MKNLLVILFSLWSLGTYSQTDHSFGEKIDEKGALAAQDLFQNADDQQPINVKVKGTVQEVCQAKGCWMTMDLGNDHSMRITFKDYGFFVPTDASGRTAVIQGQLKMETTAVETLKHFAKDAGKSEEEIAAIKEAEQDWVFVADGVLFLD